MTEIYIILSVLAVVIAGLFVVPFLKKKNVINEHVFENMDEALKIARLVLDVIPSDKIDKKKTTAVFDIADQVIDHVNALYYADSKVDKMAVSMLVMDSVLKQMDVKPSESELKLMKIIINQGIEYADKLNK
ncbi:hypothetical protein ACH6EH_06475 [Paenibacillus sp. JSM ZJ436]|uniref:hypothetical protein n=1 Tax=Paenibacillus sp. JSM ZJ436 TaxID=3376190 RepID=UPI0037B60025